MLQNLAFDNNVMGTGIALNEGNSQENAENYNQQRCVLLIYTFLYVIRMLRT